MKEDEVNIDVRNIRIGLVRSIIIMEAQSDGVDIVIACKSIKAHLFTGEEVEDRVIFEDNDDDSGTLEIDRENKTALLFTGCGHFDIVYDYIDFVE